MAHKLLVLGMDGFEISFAERLIAQGEMPHMASLREKSARFDFHHGVDKYSGLGWEHVSSGCAPSDGARWSAVTFNPRTYGTFQEPTSARPFMADLPLNTVVFDCPYLDLKAAPELRGISNWGAHDPGVETMSRPNGVFDELLQKFGPYPAQDWIYGFSWPSPAKTKASAAALVRAVDVRAEAAHWILAERLADWELAMVVVSEGHSAIEPLWHGIDPSHPLHVLPSALPAGEGLRAVYQAIDRLIGRLHGAFPETPIAVFAMHGMGINQADVAAMALLPELLYRQAFGKPYMQERSWTSHLPDGTPLLAENERWESVLAAMIPLGTSSQSTALQKLANRLVGRKRKKAEHENEMSWMPATRYRRFWPAMPAFALPSFYDGRVRVNLVGRESRGIVRRSDYRPILQEIANLLRECREPTRDGSVVDEIVFFDGAPEKVSPSQADMSVLWKNAPIGLVHPRLGNIGPLPWRRTGGHTGEKGFLYLAGNGVERGERGAAASIDVVPTIIELAGASIPNRIGGRSLAPRAFVQSRASYAPESIT